MKYKDKRDNKAYDNFGMREDEINNLLTYCKSKRKELESDAVDLSIRRNEKMKRKEYGDIFKKVVVASLSLAATAAVVMGVDTYRNNNGSKNTSIVAKESTTEYRTTEKTTENETEKDVKVADKINLNKAGQRDLESLFTLKLKGNQNRVERNFYKDKEYTVGDYIFKWESTTDMGVYYKKVNENSFKKMEGVVLNGSKETQENVFWTDGKNVIYVNDKDNKYFNYNLETCENKELILPKSETVKDPYYSIKNNNGILYIVEGDKEDVKENKMRGIWANKENTYVYDISTGEMELLIEGGAIEEILNNYVIVSEYVENTEFNKRVSIKKITDNGLEDVESFGDDVCFEESINGDNFELTRYKDTRVSGSTQKEGPYLDIVGYLSFNTKTGELTEKKE